MLYLISLVGRLLNLVGILLLHVSVVGLVMFILHDIWEQIKLYISCNCWYEAIGILLLTMASFGLFLIFYSWFLF